MPYRSLAQGKIGQKTQSFCEVPHYLVMMWVKSRGGKKGLTPLLQVLVTMTTSRDSLLTSQVVIFFSNRVMDLTRSSRCLTTARKGIFLPQVFLVLLNVLSDWGKMGTEDGNIQAEEGPCELVLYNWKTFKNTGDLMDLRLLGYSDRIQISMKWDLERPEPSLSCVHDMKRYFCNVEERGYGPDTLKDLPAVTSSYQPGSTF